MRLRSFAFLVLAVLAACGGDDDGDGGTGVDAAPVGGDQVLGAFCDPQNNCPAQAPLCITVGENPTSGFCSVGCGTSENNMTPPPAESHAACEAINESDATPACAAPLQPENGVTPWVCALACGETPEGDFGDCPGNLTCQQEDP